MYYLYQIIYVKTYCKIGNRIYYLTWIHKLFLRNNLCNCALIFVLHTVLARFYRCYSTERKHGHTKLRWIQREDSHSQESNHPLVKLCCCHYYCFFIIIAEQDRVRVPHPYYSPHANRIKSCGDKMGY